MGAEPQQALTLIRGRARAGDERADRHGSLAPPDETDPSAVQTGTWSAPDGARPLHPPAAIAHAGDAPVDDIRGFTPREALATHTARETVSEPPAVVRARLRVLPMIYILMLGIAIFSRRTVFGGDDLTLLRFDMALITALAGMIVLLRTRWSIPLTWLKALELGMLALLASRVNFAQYRLMLVFSLRGDLMMAQLTMKNFVLLTAILILTYGLYVPKSWRRAALVVGPLALLPFATLLLLYVQHPEAMR